MTDNDASKSSSRMTAPHIPSAGTAGTEEAVAAVKEVSSQLYDFLGVPGTASAPGPGIRECQGKDPNTYFQVYHPWNFLPTSSADINTAMANLKAKLSTDGWTLKDTYHDNSPNKNPNLIADNNSRMVSVWSVMYGKRDTPSIGIEVRSGCYRVPEGQTVDHS
ncbi:hypothetical protein [Streptomyces melanogenes]|uniref:hypothetical protein n=1 Tax=Streptomyces melanogenes TaxID=67326 RepID=UPI00167D5C53|nr:hypothetical protein [Streptomyces melanogenes]GGP75324.1 hypothetical protein GCM10010278_61870 [Streptomyces melanogenes]